jgi:hypothetical protein
MAHELFFEAGVVARGTTRHVFCLESVVQGKIRLLNPTVEKHVETQPQQTPKTQAPGAVHCA